MDNMVIRSLVSITLVLCGVAFFLSGYEWIYEGYGLHPLISFPISIICLLSSILISIAEKDLEESHE